ncbi:MAG: leucine-rich repeat protein [Blautia massiliensis (ex Durand et al. 2017)]
MKDVHLSAKLESIEAGAFNNCESLSKIQLPSTLKVLRGSAVQRNQSYRNQYSATDENERIIPQPTEHGGGPFCRSDNT